MQLIGVHVSSIVYEVIRTISSLIFFFYEKNLNISNDFHPLRNFCVRENLLPLLVFVPLLLFCELVFACDMFMWARNLCVKKRLARNYPNNLILLWKRKTREYQQKLNVRVASRIAKQFRTNNLKKWRTFKAAYLRFHWFNDSWIWTRNLWIGTRNSWIWTRNSWSWTRNL